MVSWWLPYLAKGPTPDFNSGPGNDSNIGCNLAIEYLFESLPKPFQSCVPICSGLLLIVSWRLSCLPKGCRPDFNNGLGGDSNSGPF